MTLLLTISVPRLKNSAALVGCGVTEDRTVDDLQRTGIEDEDWSRRRDLNPRPADYESAALPLSYTGVSSSYELRPSRFYLMC